VKTRNEMAASETSARSVVKGEEISKAKASWLCGIANETAAAQN
jgi:hypothetical protein